MSNEEIVSEIRAGRSVSENMQLLYENNLPLIKRTIKPFAAYEPMEDLLQEVYFGLLAAVQHYESSEHTKFSTYAIYWWRQSVQRYLENCGSTVRIPTHTRAKMSRIRRATSQLRQEQGKEPEIVDIAVLLGVSVEEVQEIQGYMQSVVSLDTPIAEDDSLTLADTLQADLSVENDTVDKIYSEHSKNELWGIVERYTATRENDIIKEIFLHGKTMSAVAREQGITIERVRQIKEKGLRRLRMGKAKRELLEKFDIVESRLYRGGMENYKEHGTSIVEYLAIQKLEAVERYERHLAEIEERRKERIASSN